MNSERVLEINKRRMEGLAGILEEYERLVKAAGEKGIFRAGALKPTASAGGEMVNIEFSLRAAIYSDFSQAKPGPKA
jgi:hypothetical protein